MINYRKIGGIHFLAVGNIRLSVCKARKAPQGNGRAFVSLISIAALGAAVGVSGIPHKAPPSYRLTMEANDGNLYIMDHGLTLSDCIGAMHGLRRAGCEIERSN